MRRVAFFATTAALLCLFSGGTAQARGFGGFRGGFHYSYSYRPAAFGGYHYGVSGGYHYAAARTGDYRYDGVSRDRLDSLRPLPALRPLGAEGWRGAFDRTRFPTDLGLARYSAFGIHGFHTSYWSRDYLGTRGRVVRTGFRYYHCFRPDWFLLHPRCWRPRGWEWALYWRHMEWGKMASWLALTDGPRYYDYGSNVVESDDTVWNEGLSLGTPGQYAQRTAELAAQGQAANATPEQQWKPLGVFALVSGDEKTSKNLFQLAVNKDGVIRGNYYDGLADTTTEVYGQIDKKTQRAAWTIGKKTDRVFEAGTANLTRSETPILIHANGGASQQSMLVRIDPPKDPQNGK